jgi:hypothetical protein
LKITQIEDLFDRVKNEYFPRWDRSQKWHIVKDPSFDWDAGCDQDTKTIIIREYATITLICHEICHSNYPNHGKYWQKAMLNVAAQARSKGQRKLAERIVLDVKHHKRKCMRISVSRVRKDLICAVKDNPDITLEDAVKSVAASWFRGPKDLLARYPNFKSVYDEIKQQIKTT